MWMTVMSLFVGMDMIINPLLDLHHDSILRKEFTTKTQFNYTTMKLNFITWVSLRNCKTHTILLRNNTWMNTKLIPGGWFYRLQYKCNDIQMACLESVMPSLHLLRSSYDGLVYDFPCDFGGIVGGYGLRGLRLHYLRSSCDFMYWAS